MSHPQMQDPVIDHAAITSPVIEIVARALDRSPEDVHPSSRIWSDLGAESLDMLDIAFSLESAFGIRLPHTDLLGRASDYFGEENIVQGGVLSEFALELIRRVMPEFDRKQLHAGLKPMDFRRLITVESLVQVVIRLLQFKSRLVCPACSGRFCDSKTAPELECVACGLTQAYPSGEQALSADLAAAARQIGFPMQSPNTIATSADSRP
jgi:acyl carrier protein